MNSVHQQRSHPGYSNARKISNLLLTKHFWKKIHRLFLNTLHTKYDVGNASPGLRQIQKYGEIKPFNGFPQHLSNCILHNHDLQNYIRKGSI